MTRTTLLALCGMLPASVLIALSGCSDDHASVSTVAEPPCAVTALPSQPSDGAPDPTGRYIVQFTKEVADHRARAEELAERLGFTLARVYRFALKGFACTLTDSQVDRLRRAAGILTVEPDLVMEAFEQYLPSGVDRMDVERNPAAAIDNTDAELDVDIAILDTGIDTDHPDLNVAGGKHFYSICLPGLGCVVYENDNYDDENGHGTHCGGIAAARDNDIGVVGVAPGARLWAVKVLSDWGFGFTSDIIAGLDYVTEHADVIEVVNMSLGGSGQSAAYHTAVRNCVAAGVVVVAAAGNESTDIFGADGVYDSGDDILPGSYPEVATISALADADGMPGGLGAATAYGDDDSFASFSNYATTVVAGNPVSSPGGGIDLLLPGVEIASTLPGGAYGRLSGTSMASPHAAGLAALYIVENGRATDAAGVYAVRQALIDNAAAQDGFQGLAVGNDPDGYREALGWAGTAGIAHADIAVTAFSGPLSITAGETIRFNASVQNRGTLDMAAPTTVRIVHPASGTVLFSRTIPNGLTIGRQVSGSVDITSPANVSPGAHEVVFEHDATDGVGYNDRKSIIIDVVAAAGSST